MNIETLQEYIDTFIQDVMDSGFKRDLDDFISSLSASQNNILALRDIASKVSASLDDLYTSDLPENLALLLPSEDSPPFTRTAYNDRLKSLIEDTEIQQAEFFQKLSEILSKLQAEIQHNQEQIEEIQQFIEPYITKDIEETLDAGLAIIAIIFKEQKTITSLKQLTRTLAAWNRILPVYHQLLKSEPPKDIEIVEVQNGSIDFIFNIDVDVAIDLAKLFKIGFKVFAAYLSYKHMMKPIIDSYHGNKKLIAQEEDREELMLENIGEAIKEEIVTQHNEAKKHDKKVDGTAIPKKIEQVTKLLTAHIVNGNDFKLLSVAREITEEEEDDSSDVRESLRELSVKARRQLRSIPQKAQEKLLQAYGTINDSEDEDK